MNGAVPSAMVVEKDVVGPSAMVVESDSIYLARGMMRIRTPSRTLLPSVLARGL